MIAGTILLWLQAAGTPLPAPPVPDVVLATQRGGFRLPNGIDVALTVQTQTAINGAVVLQTVFRADRGVPSLTVYTPKDGEVAAASPHPASAATAATAGPSISFDGRNGIRVGTSPVQPQVMVGQTAGGAIAVPDGLAAIDPDAADGSVQRMTNGGLQTIVLNTDDIRVTHFAGNAFGSAIANSGNDRAIDTQTTVSIDLMNATPDVVGSAMFRVEAVAIDAALMRVR